MKIFLTGGTGQVGFELQRSLAPLGEVVAPTRAQLDLTDLNQVARVLRQLAPDVIINAAAWTAVDAAETQQAQAYVLNAELPEQLAQYARQNDALLVHYSSDYVYAGDGDAPRNELAACLPLSVYGRSKLAGDQAILDSHCRHMIFRTSWVYSARGNNFLNTMLRLGRERSELKVVNDQIGAPTPARLIAQVTALALHQVVAPHATRFTSEALTSAKRSQARSALYHLTAQGETSWHGFAQEILRQATELGEPLAIRPEGVLPIPSQDYPTPAKRPLNSRLCCQELERALGITLPSWQEQLALTLREELGVRSEA